MDAKTETVVVPPLRLGPLARVRLLFFLLLACDQAPFTTL